MKYIKIDKNSRMSIDDNNYTLQYRSKGIDPKTGEKADGSKWALGGYFPTMESLLNDWVTNAPAYAEEPPTTLKDIVEVIKNAEKHIAKMLA